MTKLKLKRDGFESNHTHWIDISKCYGWDYRTAMNALRKHGEYKGYILDKPEPELMNVSIPCQKLRASLYTPKGCEEIEQTSSFNPDEDGLQSVKIVLGQFDNYTIHCEVNNRIGSAEVATDANGHDLECDTTEVTIEINKVININGEVLVLDEETKDLLLSKIEL